jgi:hypothetical protein
MNNVFVLSVSLARTKYHMSWVVESWMGSCGQTKMKSERGNGDDSLDH